MAMSLHIVVYNNESQTTSVQALDEDLVQRFARGTTDAFREGVIDDYQAEHHPQTQALCELAAAMSYGYYPYGGHTFPVDQGGPADDEWIEVDETVIGLSWDSMLDARKQVGLCLLERMEESAPR